MRFVEINATPEIAKKWLGNMEKNRPIRADKINQYAADMKRKKFTSSPQPICFNCEGKMIDGQHRAMAIIQSGMTVPMTVAYDVPDDSVLDRGAPRSSGDSLYMRGILPLELSKPEPIALTNCYLGVINPSKRRKITDADRGNFLNAYGAEVLRTIEISHKGASTPLCKKAGTQTAIFAALQSDVSANTLYRFAECVNTGFSNGPHESAAIILRNYLLERRLNGQRSTDELVMTSEMAIKDFSTGIKRRLKYSALKHIYINPNSGNTSANDN